jgi:hypothetical protein
VLPCATVCTPAYARFQLTYQLPFVIILLKFVGDAEGHIDIKTKYGWHELYATALLETDWSTIDEKIQVAEKGIRVRLQEFSMNHGGTPEENQAIEDALNGLNILRKDVAAWQGSKRAS